MDNSQNLLKFENVEKISNQLQDFIALQVKENLRKKNHKINLLRQRKKNQLQHN